MRLYAKRTNTRVIQVKNFYELYGQSIPLSNGKNFKVEAVKVVELPCFNRIHATLYDVEQGLCALVVREIINPSNGSESCDTLLKRMRMLDFDSYESVLTRMNMLIKKVYTSNLVIQNANGKIHRLIVHPIPRGRCVASYNNRALKLRAISEFIAKGLNPMGPYEQNSIIESAWQLNYNLTHVAIYDEARDRIMFNTPGLTTLITLDIIDEVRETLQKVLAHLEII